MFEKFSVLDKSFFINLENGFCSENKYEILESLKIKRPQAPIYRFPLYKKVTFCIEHTNTCNLNCSYCFNKSKDNRIAKFNLKYIHLFDNLFEQYKSCDKYFIDLSSDAEPLTNLEFIKNLVFYVEKKQEEIRKEILITFVTNGILLTKEIVDFLQTNGIIFGVSFDGNEEVHDLYRRDINNKPTYKRILNNVSNIVHREFLGCAVTLTNNVFSLVDSLKNLINLFPTISYKFARLKNCFNYETMNNWKKEYDKLTTFLLEEIKKDNYKYIFSLLNGDDYFGKFIYLSFLNGVPLNRCDAGNGRIFIDIDFNIFPCVPLKQFNKYQIQYKNSNLIDKNRTKELFHLTKCNNECSDCKFNALCGGECLAERELNGGNNTFICEIKKHLILLSKYLYLSLIDDERRFEKISQFVIDKYRKKGTSERFKEIVNENTNLSFKECKSLYYKEINNDKNQQLRY